jgi:hypothetical protein
MNRVAPELLTSSVSPPDSSPLCDALTATQSHALRKSQEVNPSLLCQQPSLLFVSKGLEMFCCLLLGTAASLELAVSSIVEKEQSKHCSIDASNSTHKLEPTMIDCSGDINAGPEWRQNQG